MNRFIAAAALAVALSGCLHDEGGESASRIEGLLMGTSTRSATQRDAIAFASADRLMIVEGDATPYFFDGDYTIVDGVLSASAMRIYAASPGPTFVRSYTETASLSGTATADAWQFTITGPSITASFEFTHDPADQQNSSLSRTQGTWHFNAGPGTASTLTVTGNGTTSSVNESGCVSAGAITVIDPAFNLYDSATTVTDAGGTCADSLEGNYSGLIALVDYAGTGTDQLIVLLAKAEFMFIYPYTRQ